MAKPGRELRINRDLAKALSRWENEGGSMGAASSPAAHIVTRLGAAVVMEWDNLPTEIRRKLFESATKMNDPARQLRLKRKTALLLHANKALTRAG